MLLMFLSLWLHVLFFPLDLTVNQIRMYISRTIEKHEEIDTEKNIYFALHTLFPSKAIRTVFVLTQNRLQRSTYFIQLLRIVEICYGFMPHYTIGTYWSLIKSFYIWKKIQDLPEKIVKWEDTCLRLTLKQRDYIEWTTRSVILKPLD